MALERNKRGLVELDQELVQQRIERLLTYLLLFSFPAMVATYARAWDTGQQQHVLLQLGFYILLLLGLLLGRHLSFRARVNFYILPIVGFAFEGLVTHGLFGQGLIIMVLACLMAALINPVFYRNVMILCGSLVTISAVKFLSSDIPLSFTADQLNGSLAAWVAGGSTLLITWLAVNTWSEMQRSLVERSAKISSREKDLAIILEAVEDGVIAVDSSMRVIYINPVACRLCECGPEESIGHPLNEVLNINSGNEMQLSAHEIFRGTEGEGAFFLISRSGMSMRIRLSVRGTGIQAPDEVSYVLAFRDITQDHRREQQLRHAEKMETLGRLTSTLVHDFNNHISVIQMSREMIEMKLEKGIPLKDELNSIDLACQGAHQLAMQLRGFVRQDDSPGIQQHSTHELVQLSQPLLRKAVPQKIQLEYGLWAQEDSILVDRGQLQNALLNLVVNAADAIEENGTIVISTLNRRIEEGECSASRFDIRPGLYIRLSISDSGSGIPEDIRAHIFEPFFTTKGSGKGSGLGLASVVDLMTLSEGQVSMETRMGQGSTFHLDFPLTELRSAAEEPGDAAELQELEAAAAAAQPEDRLSGLPGTEAS